MAATMSSPIGMMSRVPFREENMMDSPGFASCNEYINGVLEEYKCAVFKFNDNFNQTLREIEFTIGQADIYCNLDSLNSGVRFMNQVIPDAVFCEMRNEIFEGACSDVMIDVPAILNEGSVFIDGALSSSPSIRMYEILLLMTLIENDEECACLSVIEPRTDCLENRLMDRFKSVKAEKLKRIGEKKF